MPKEMLEGTDGRTSDTACSVRDQVWCGHGRIVDKEFRAGAARCLEIAMREKSDLIVLQSRSPSCGVKQRYDGTFTGTLTDGPV